MTYISDSDLPSDLCSCNGDLNGVQFILITVSFCLHGTCIRLNGARTVKGEIIVFRFLLVRLNWSSVCPSSNS